MLVADAAMNSAARMGRPVAGETVSNPGRTITSTPRKPTMVALQRRRRTTSPSTRAAAMVANSGTVKLSATACASGSSATALNQLAMAQSPSAARAKWSPRRSVRRPPRPARASQGSMNISANTLRKKTTCSGSRLALANRMSPAIMENPSVAPSIRRAPWTTGGMAERRAESVAMTGNLAPPVRQCQARRRATRGRSAASAASAPGSGWP